jgi:hypothetical protein
VRTASAVSVAGLAFRAELSMIWRRPPRTEGNLIGHDRSGCSRPGAPDVRLRGSWPWAERRGRTSAGVRSRSAGQAERSGCPDEAGSPWGGCPPVQGGLLRGLPRGPESCPTALPTGCAVGGEKRSQGGARRWRSRGRWRNLPGRAASPCAQVHERPLPSSLTAVGLTPAVGP